MGSWELWSFLDDLKKLRDFFVQLEVRADELRYRGLGAVRSWDDFSSILELLPTIEKQMSASIRTARFTDQDVHARLTRLVVEGHLTDGILNLLVSLNVAETRSNLGTSAVRVSASVVDALDSTMSAFFSIFGMNTGKRRNVFASIENDVSVRQTLIQLERTISLIDELHDLVESREIYDEDHFKPSNVDLEKINLLLTQSEKLLNQDAFTPKAIKKEISDAINNAKLELSENNPNWRKIIGALVIASTILSGVASAPAALEVIQTTIKEILGTSVENVVPLQRRPPSSNDKIQIALADTHEGSSD